MPVKLGLLKIGRDRQKGSSRAVEPSDPEYARLWKIVNESNGDRYTAHQKETSLPISVVILTPL